MSDTDSQVLAEAFKSLMDRKPLFINETQFITLTDYGLWGLMEVTSSSENPLQPTYSVITFLQRDQVESLVLGMWDKLAGFRKELLWAHDRYACYVKASFKKVVEENFNEETLVAVQEEREKEEAEGQES